METPKPIDPKELIEQDGPNKGAISDVDLARVGAEATDRVIEQDKKHMFWDDPNYLRFKRYDKEAEKEGITVEEKIKREADDAGENAMAYEVQNRVSEVTFENGFRTEPATPEQKLASSKFEDELRTNIAERHEETQGDSGAVEE